MSKVRRGSIEKDLHKQGLSVVGVDEVGKGCLAGPVFASATILDFKALFALPAKQRALIRDSKTLSASQRETLIPLIHKISLSHATAKAEVIEIEQLGLQRATFLAMRRALHSLPSNFDFLLIDGKQKLPQLSQEPFRQQAVIKGDNLCYCIAAASILAKVARDQFMHKLAIKYPEYGFETHVGYATGRHREALKRFGACPIHRKNFAPVREQITIFSPRVFSEQALPTS